MVVKRAFDVLASVTALIVLLPLGLLAAAAVALNMGTPVFYRQARPGLNGEPFTLIKFRTMRHGNAPDGQRLTRLGRFLRASSLDELPELINVIRGDMSLVGPRPLLTEYLPLYNEEQFRRHEVLPGITGWAQVNGRNDLSWEEKFELDIWYVDNRSFWLDLRIIWFTVFRVFSAKGINQPGSATAERFKGTGI